MNIGIPKERNAGGKEIRAVLLPPEVKKITQEGHNVFIEKDTGIGVYATNDQYEKAGATILRSPREIFRKELVVKIKPPLVKEFRMMKKNILFSMIHAEQNPKYLRLLKEREVRAVAQELVRNRYGERLIECTEMAGHQGMLMAFHHSPKIPEECNVLILGYGNVATGAIRVSSCLGAKIKILRKAEYGDIKHFVRGKDIVVNGICWPKVNRDHKYYIITRKMLKLLSPGAVILDLAVDYPGPIETCHPTQINRPFYYVDGIKHICVFGYPGLSPVSSSRRYSRQVCSLILEIAKYGLDNAPDYIRKARIT